MILARIACLFNRHQPKRDTVHWTGFHYTATCRSCGRALRRRQHGGWRAAPAPAKLPAPEQTQAEGVE